MLYGTGVLSRQAAYDVSMSVSAAKRRIISLPSALATTRLRIPSRMKNCSISVEPWWTSCSPLR